MASFKVLNTNHTSFTVSNLERTVAFFRDALNFEVVSQAPRDPKIISQVTGIEGAHVMIAYVRGPGHYLELIEYLGPEDRSRVVPRPCDVGFAHVAFDVDDIDAAIAAAGGHEIRPISDPATIDKGPNAGGKVAYLRDPDGITIEFIQPPRHHEQRMDQGMDESVI
jgi:catechol 2,3-dioxygenase-like lactoylglutathione lyase family enzyme